MPATKPKFSFKILNKTEKKTRNVIYLEVCKNIKAFYCSWEKGGSFSLDRRTKSISVHVEYVTDGFQGGDFVVFNCFSMHF